MSNIIKTWNEKTIRWRKDDQYGSLTDMAQATGKRVNDWVRLSSSIEYIVELESVTGIPATEIIQIKQGGTPEEQGTWAHRRVCIRFAQWCSPKFAVQVDTWVEELMNTGSVSLALPKDYLSALKALVSSEEEKLKLAAEKELYAGKLDEAEDVIQGYRAIISDEVCLSVKQVADALNIPRLGRNNLVKYLREKQVILPESTGPYRKALEAGWVIAETNTYIDGQGIPRPIVTTRLTFKGLSWLVKTLIKDEYPVNVTAAQIWDTYNSPAPPQDNVIYITG